MAVVFVLKDTWSPVRHAGTVPSNTTSGAGTGRKDPTGSGAGQNNIPVADATGSVLTLAEGKGGGIALQWFPVKNFREWLRALIQIRVRSRRFNGNLPKEQWGLSASLVCQAIRSFIPSDPYVRGDMQPVYL